jgi:hypothetical protein
MAYKRKYRSRRSKKSRRTRYSRKGRRTFQTRVKRVLLKTAETKYFNIAEENVNLYHYVGYSVGVPIVSTPGSLTQFFNQWADIQKGTERYNRIGDNIIPTGMSVKL